MKYNYHTHTVRCGHATDEDYEYVEAAIAAGLTKMGFSDHAPFRFPDGFTFDCHVQPERAEEYIAAVEGLKKAYQGKIELHVGFETEYFPSYHREKTDYYRSLGAEYLILGQHYLFDGHPDTVFAPTPTADESLLESYCSSLIAAMETGQFTYVAHPDMFYFVGDEKTYERQVRRLRDASVANGIPLEINFLGLRGKRHYPNPRFWEIVGKGGGADVVFGLDAHAAKDAGNFEGERAAVAMIEKYGLRFVENPKLLKI